MLFDTLLLDSGFKVVEGAQAAATDACTVGAGSVPRLARRLCRSRRHRLYRGFSVKHLLLGMTGLDASESDKCSFGSLCRRLGYFRDPLLLQHTPRSSLTPVPRLSALSVTAARRHPAPPPPECNELNAALWQRCSDVPSMRPLPCNDSLVERLAGRSTDHGGVAAWCCVVIRQAELAASALPRELHSQLSPRAAAFNALLG